MTYVNIGGTLIRDDGVGLVTRGQLDSRNATFQSHKILRAFGW